MLLIFEGMVLLSLGIRETVAGSWLGALLAWGLAILAALSARALQSRSQ
jgi:hypothetical protein